MTVSGRSSQKRDRSIADAGRGRGKDIHARLQRILNALRRGGTPDVIDNLEQVAQLIYLKLLDEREPAKGSKIFPGMAERFRWSLFRDRRGVELQQFLGDEVLPYLGTLDREAPTVAEYYRDATLKIDDPSTLESIVAEIDGIDFQKLEPDEMGTILEDMLARMNISGEFRTPRHVRALMVALLDPHDGDTVYDPACGTGGFLTDAVTYLLAKHSSKPCEVPIYGEEWLDEQGLTLEEARKRYSLQTWWKEGGQQRLDRGRLGQHIHGHDVSRRMMRLARMSLELQGIGPVSLRRANSLSAYGGLEPVEMARKYDVVLCAPPFGDAPGRESIRPDLPVTSTRMEILFLEIAMNCLAPGGRAAVIVPDNLLFHEGSTYIEVRRTLITRYEVLAVISLPPSTLRPYSATKTSILVFRRPSEPHRGTARVWFYAIERDGLDLDRRPTPEANDIPDLLNRWKDFARSSYARPPGSEAGNVVHAGEENRCWWARGAVIEENKFDLSAQRYKPRSPAGALLNTETQLEELTMARDLFSRALETFIANISPSAAIRGRAKLGDLVEVIQGKTPSTNEPAFWDGDIPWASPKDIKRHVLYNAKDHINQRAIEDTPLRIVEPPAVLIVTRGMILTHRVPVALTAVPLAISQDLRALRPLPHSGIDAWYLFAYLNAIQDLLLARTFGTAHGSRSLPQRIILDFDVPIPTSEMRAQVGRMMKSYIRLAETAEKQRAIVQTIFPALLGTVFGRRQEILAANGDPDEGHS